MTGDEYQKLASRTEYTPEFVRVLHDRDGDFKLARLLHGMMGVCTESGELQDMVKKYLIYNKPFDIVNVLEECGDLLWYIALSLSACGYTMDDCMKRNIDKLRQRYPDKFTQEAARERDLDGERAVLEGKVDEHY